MIFGWKFGLIFKRKIMLYFTLIIMSMAVSFWWIVSAEKDLLYYAVENSKDLIIFPSQNSKRIWNWIFKGQKDVSVTLFDEDGDRDPDHETVTEPWLFAKVTRFLLVLLVVLSVTMILYNWIIYIVKTWKWEDSKNLVKNIAYIVVWILVALFSVIIITLLRSVPKTIENDSDLKWNIKKVQEDSKMFFWETKSD